MRSQLSPERLLAAYAAGIFPMADGAGRIHWLAPDPRAILELDSFKASRSLRNVRRRKVFAVTINRAFADVLAACAQRGEGTWISAEIKQAYTELHRLGFAHSVEAWKGDDLAGGLYGVSMGGAFFGESMFFRTTDASKVAFMVLVERMRERGFSLMDIQFMTEHLRQFGAKEIPRKEYERRLDEAVRRPCTFVDGPDPIVVDESA